MALVLATLLALTLGVFLARPGARGHKRSARVAQAGESFLLSASLMEYGLWLAGPFARLATRLGLSPDLLSWGSLVFHFAAAAALAGGRFSPAAWLLVLGGACDSLDGSVARARGLASDAGEVLDAAIDRWAEMAVFFGLAYHYRASDLGMGLSLFAAAGAVMVSYTRAKAQAMGVGSSGGFMQRHERAVYLIAAVLAAALLEAYGGSQARVPVEGFPLPLADWPVLAALAVIGFFATVASLQRTARTREVLRDSGTEAEATEFGQDAGATDSGTEAGATGFGTEARADAGGGR